MNCEETRRFLHAYLDDELDLARALDLELHLEDCPACARLVRQYRQVRAAIQGGGLYYPAPERLRQRVQGAVRQAGRPAVAGRRATWRWLGAAIALAAVAFLAWTLLYTRAMPPAGEALAHEVLSSHVRSLMANHLTDIPSSDQHTVKPWFNGKLDFSPPVEDLASQGFPLVGGRLDYVDNRPVAALVYGRAKHLINLFIWPADQAGESLSPTQTEQGYHLIHWQEAGMNYWAVSDLELAQLQTFVQDIRQGVEATAVPYRETK